MLIAAATSALLRGCSAWTWRKAVRDSLTPPAQDSMSAVVSCRTLRMSVARSALDGLCTSATATPTSSSPARASRTHRGVRRTGQPVAVTLARGGSWRVSDDTGRSASFLVHQGHVSRQYLLGDRAQDLGDDVMAGRSEEHTSELQSQFHLVCRLQ